MSQDAIEGFKYGTTLAYWSGDHGEGALLRSTEFTVWTVGDDRRKARDKPVRSDSNGQLPDMGISPFPELDLVDQAGRTIRVLGERGMGQYGAIRPMSKTVGDLTPGDIGRDVRVEAGRLSVEGQLIDFRAHTSWISDQLWGAAESVRVVGRKTVTVEVGPATINDLPLDAKVVLL